LNGGAVTRRLELTNPKRGCGGERLLTFAKATRVQGCRRIEMSVQLPASPTPKRFATNETRLFAAAFDAVAGKDKRPTASEIAKAKQKLGGALSVAVDNIENWYAKHGAKKPTKNAAMKSHYKYAFEAAKSAAGPDGRLSTKDAENLPADLRDNFQYLRRGVLPPAKS
jgi:hypothetical protein